MYSIKFILNVYMLIQVLRYYYTILILYIYRFDLDWIGIFEYEYF
jgi:hypothetical protein